MNSRCGSALAAAALLMGVWMQAAAAPSIQHTMQHTTQRVVEQTNELRRTEGVAPLTPEQRLNKAAQTFAEHMARTGRYGHDADGRTPRDRAAAQRYTACAIAENIAYYFNTEPVGSDTLATEFVSGWRDSPPHRRNLLDPALRELGVGVAQSRRTGRWYAVQLFAQPSRAADRVDCTP